MDLLHTGETIRDNAGHLIVGDTCKSRKRPSMLKKVTDNNPSCVIGLAFEAGTARAHGKAHHSVRVGFGNVRCDVSKDKALPGLSAREPIRCELTHVGFLWQTEVNMLGDAHGKPLSEDGVRDRTLPTER